MRVLYLTHRLPYAPNRGDRIRAFHTLRALRPRAHVDLISFAHDAQEASHALDLQGLADTVQTVALPHVRNRIRGALGLPSATPLTHFLLDSPEWQSVVNRVIADRPPDVVLAYCSGMARLALAPPLDRFPLVIDLVDVDSLKWRALAESSAAPLRWIYAREARRLSAFEGQASTRAFATTVVNERELGALRLVAPGARVEAVANGVDREYWRPREPPATGDEVVFCGVMNYAPNEEGALWLAERVWPLVRQRRPRARLWLVGAQPTRRVVALGRNADGIEVTGAVPDVRPFLWRGSVAAAPLRVSRGVQNKVLEAVAAGLPVVVTSPVAAGLPVEVAPACRNADAPEAFAAALVDCLDRAPAARRAETDDIDFSALTWEGRLDRLASVIEAAADRRNPSRM